MSFKSIYEYKFSYYSDPNNRFEYYTINNFIRGYLRYLDECPEECLIAIELIKRIKNEIIIDRFQKSIPRMPYISEEECIKAINMAGFRYCQIWARSKNTKYQYVCERILTSGDATAICSLINNPNNYYECALGDPIKTKNSYLLSLAFMRHNNGLSLPKIKMLNSIYDQGVMEDRTPIEKKSINQNGIYNVIPPFETGAYICDDLHVCIWTVSGIDDNSVLMDVDCYLTGININRTIVPTCCLIGRIKISINKDLVPLVVDNESYLGQIIDDIRRDQGITIKRNYTYGIAPISILDIIKTFFLRSLIYLNTNIRTNYNQKSQSHKITWQYTDMPLTDNRRIHSVGRLTLISTTKPRILKKEIIVKNYKTASWNRRQHIRHLANNRKIVVRESQCHRHHEKSGSYEPPKTTYLIQRYDR